MKTFLLFLFSIAFLTESMASELIKKGAVHYQTCAECHSLRPGIHLSGPSLANLWGQDAASVEGFRRYSNAIKFSNVKWDEKTMDKWLEAPEAVIKNNYMTFKGIENASARKELVAFLKVAMSPGGAKKIIGKGLASATTFDGVLPKDLSKSYKEFKVVKINKCKDTYRIQTESGFQMPFWEKNVRFKTDSSKFGPRGNHGVLVRVGSKGDRVAVVFKDFKTLASSVTDSCR